MPVLRNAKHELFAQRLAAGKDATEAYVLAGYKEDRGHASRLATNGSIVARIAELQVLVAEKTVEKTAITKAWVIDQLVDNHKRAMQHEAVLDEDGKPIGDYRYQGQVANRALELIGKELGMFVDRKEVGKPGEFDFIDKMTPDELREFIDSGTTPARLRASAPADGGGNREAGSKPH